MTIAALLVAALILMPSYAHAQQYTGESAFAAWSPRFPCDRYLRESDKHDRPYMPVLWETFGDSAGCSSRNLRAWSNRPHLYQIHLSNESCRYFGRCREGELLPGLTTLAYERALVTWDYDAYKAIADRLTVIRAFTDMNGNSNTTWAISTGLESRFGDQANANLSAFIRLYWANLVVRSGVRCRQVLAGSDVVECHNLDFVKQPGIPCILNADGHKLTASQFRRFTARGRRCIAVASWDCKLQGGCKGTTVPPRDRALQ